MNCGVQRGRTTRSESEQNDLSASTGCTKMPNTDEVELETR